MCHLVKSGGGTKKKGENVPFFLSLDLNTCYPVEGGRGTPPGLIAI